MPNAPCSVCTHADREKIEQALVLGKASLRQLERQYGVCKDALSRHQRRGHMASALAKSQEFREMASGDGLAIEVRTLIGEAHRLRALAEGRRDIRTAIRGLDTALRALELYGRATGELNDKRGPNLTVQVNVTPQQGVEEAVDLLLLLGDRAGLLRIIEQLQARVADLENASPLLLAGEVGSGVDIENHDSGNRCPS